MTIKALRANSNMTQQQVAKVLNITTQSYRNKECGKREFKFSEMIKLAELFHCSLDDFR